MFSEKLKKYAESQYEERLGILGETGRIVEEKMKSCTPDEQILMKFLYGTMPVGMPENMNLKFSWAMSAIHSWYIRQWTGAGIFPKKYSLTMFYITGLIPKISLTAADSFMIS